MPKAASSRIICAKNEATGLLERIELSDPHRFDHIGKRRSRPRKKEHPYQPVPGRREELARLAELRHTKDLLQKEEYSRRTLAERLRTPPPPLIDRIEPAPPIELPEIKPTPEGLHFRKKQVVSKERAFTRKLNAVATRLTAVFENTDRLRGENEELRQAVLAKGRLFNDLAEILSECSQEFTEERWWAKLDRDLRAVGGISFKDLRVRYVEVCNQIVALGNDWLVV